MDRRRFFGGLIAAAAVVALPTAGFSASARARTLSFGERLRYLNYSPHKPGRPVTDKDIEALTELVTARYITEAQAIDFVWTNTANRHDCRKGWRGGCEICLSEIERWHYTVASSRT